MSESNHTPLPWKTYRRHDGSFEINTCDIQHDTYWIARLQNTRTTNAEANAEFIVRCVNAHQQLVDALKEYQQNNPLHHDGEAELFEQGRAALLAAGEKL